MTYEKPSCETTLGYLSSVHTADHGYFGGYLIVCPLGRPLEFHCTAPLRPSRAQRILYGSTLDAYLLGEQIGGALLRAAKLTPPVVLTDWPAMLAIRRIADVAVALVVSNDDSIPRLPNDDAVTQKRASVSDAPLAEAESCAAQFQVGRFVLQCLPGFEADRTTIIGLMERMIPNIDLGEPFGRIHEAIREAQRLGSRTLERHDQAA
jgi:hypothetical protein